MDVKRTLHVNSTQSAVIYYIKNPASYKKCTGCRLDEVVRRHLDSRNRSLVAVTNAFGPSTGLSLSKCTHHGLQNVARRELLCERSNRNMI